MDNNDSDDDDEFFIDRIDNLQEETLVERTVSETNSGGSKRKKKITPNYNVAGVIRVELNELTQNSLGIEVGPDITGEHPWKMVKKELLYDNMQVLGDDSIFTQFKPDIDVYEEDELLFGYILEESNDYDEYYVCLTTDAKNHCQLQAEKFLKKQARKLEKSVFKVSNPWKSLGSEKEVDETMVINSRPLLRVEIKTKYPTQFQPKRFQDRDTDATRDGYAELVPTRTVFDNVVKKRIDVAVQANPEKISSEAQTVPKFPQNVWTQCGSEVCDVIIPSLISDEERLKEIEGEEAVQNPVGSEIPKVETNPGKKVRSAKRDLTQERLNDFIIQRAPEILNLLDFNSAIDIYNVDYPDLLVSDQHKDNEDTYFEEFMCFTDDRAKDKFIISSTWHSSTPGIVAVAYADFTDCILDSSHRPDDEVHRAVFGKNPVLVWSISDGLRPILYLESSREVTTLSFCPFDENILIGGCINGQIIIWDLTDKLHNTKVLEVLTEAQERNRIAINLEMGWMKATHQKSVIRPAALSDLAFDHVASVTSIIWLHPKYEIKNTGKMINLGDDDQKSLQFLSSSKDGTIFVWDLKNTPSIVSEDIIVENVSRIQDRPATLTPSPSPYSVLDGVLQPVYKIIVKSDSDQKTETINAIEFGYPIIQREKIFKNTSKEDDSAEEVNSFQPKENVVPVIWVATTTGEFFKISWNGHLIASEDKVNSEVCVFLSKTKIHDGSIVCVARHPFFPDIVATLGGRIFALWSDNLPNRPLMWKRMNYTMTDASWSEYIPSQIFITTEVGSIDIWDFLQRSDLPIKTQIISGKMLTGIFMQPYSTINNSFGVADYKGNLKLLNYPKAFKQESESYFVQTKRFFEKELEIKKGFQSWQDHWSVKHAEVLEKRKKNEDDLIRENELKAKISAKKERERKEIAEEATRLEKNRVIGAEEKWQKLQWEYVEKVLQEKKKMNKRELLKQVKPLEELEAQKLERIKKQIEILSNKKKIFDESVAILFPEAAPQPPVIKKVMPIEEIIATKKKYIDEYNNIAQEADKFISENSYEFEFNWQKTLMTGKERRRGMDVRSSMIRMKNERLQHALRESNIVLDPASGSKD